MNNSDKNPFEQWIQLAQPRLGARIVFATDDFFAPKERLIDPTDPVFIEDKYDDHGKWMDGWESRRRRDGGHDYCVIKLNMEAMIHGVDIDTSFFTGNFPPEASIEACFCHEDRPTDDQDWHEILPRVSLAGDSHHYLPVVGEKVITHLRLNIYPDGGVARLRVYGEVHRNFTDCGSATNVDLVAIENGGRALCCSDEHYGTMHNLNLPGPAINMGDGWETGRRRGPGNDWVIMMLGHLGIVNNIEINTAHFKGNYPDRVEVLAARVDSMEGLKDESKHWPILLPSTKLAPDSRHCYRDELENMGPISHIRMNIYPDGGISRLRLFGSLIVLPNEIE